MKFGIVMPTRNQGKFIGHSIKSILKQKGDFSIHLQVIDGASTDETLTVLAGLADDIQAGRLTANCRGFTWSYVSEPDRGQSDAINKGFRLVKGDLLCWLNSDDQFTEGALAKVVDVFRSQKSIGVVVGSAMALDENGNVKWLQKPRLPSFESLIVDGECPPQPSVFWRRELAERVGPLNESLRYTMDFELWIRFWASGARFRVIEELLSTQIYHTDCKSMEGEFLFEKFLPEKSKIQKEYGERFPLRVAVIRSRRKVYSYLRKILAAGPRILFRGLYSLALALKGFWPTRVLGSWVKRSLKRRDWGRDLLSKVSSLRG